MYIPDAQGQLGIFNFLNQFPDIFSSFSQIFIRIIFVMVISKDFWSVFGSINPGHI